MNKNELLEWISNKLFNKDEYYLSIILNLLVSTETNTNEDSILNKLSILCIELGMEKTKKIMLSFDSLIIEELSKYLILNENIEEDKKIESLSYLKNSLEKLNDTFKGGFDFTSEVLLEVLGPEEKEKILNRIHYKFNIDYNFSYLKNIDNKIIAEFIIYEHPQTIALILSHVDEEKAAGILNYFPVELSSDILKRIMEIGDINPYVVKKISVLLETKLAELSNYKLGLGGVDFAERIFNNLEKKDEVLSKIDSNFLEDKGIKVK